MLPVVDDVADLEEFTIHAPMRERELKRLLTEKQSLTKVIILKSVIN